MRQAYKSNAKSATPSAANQSAIGNPGEGTPATIIGDRWFWLATETIKRVIEEGGQAAGLAAWAFDFLAAYDADNSVRAVLTLYDGS